MMYSFLFQSTLPTRGSDYDQKWRSASEMISIHAPHEGERHHAHIPPCAARPISIHAPHEGERHG